MLSSLNPDASSRTSMFCLGANDKPKARGFFLSPPRQKENLNSGRLQLPSVSFSSPPSSYLYFCCQTTQHALNIDTNTANKTNVNQSAIGMLLCTVVEQCCISQSPSNTEALLWFGMYLHVKWSLRDNVWIFWQNLKIFTYFHIRAHGAFRSAAERLQ